MTYEDAEMRLLMALEIIDDHLWDQAGIAERNCLRDAAKLIERAQLKLALARNRLGVAMRKTLTERMR